MFTFEEAAQRFAKGGAAKKEEPSLDLPPVQGGIQEGQPSLPAKGVVQAGANKGREAYLNERPDEYSLMHVTNDSKSFKPDNTLEKDLGRNFVPKDKVKITQPASPGTSDAHVFTKDDTHPALEHNKAQKALVHGIDLKKLADTSGQRNAGSTGEYGVSGFGENAQGKKVIVKGAIPSESVDEFGGDKKSHSKVSTAMRETLFHNLGHAMGMGKYIPTTATIDDPYDEQKEQGPFGNHYSVQEVIPNAEHFNGSKKHNEMLADLHKSGEIHKLAILNSLLGNTDRHGGNFMMSPKGLHLIDHNWTFGWHKGNSRSHNMDMNSYLSSAQRAAGTEDTEHIHESAKQWIRDLDPETIKKVFKKNKVGISFSKPMLEALQRAKGIVESSDKHGVPLKLDDVRNAIMVGYKDIARGKK